jgi:hypothetical protein
MTSAQSIVPKRALHAARRADGEMAELVDAAFEQESEAVARLAAQLVLPHVRLRGVRGAGVELDDLMDALAGHVELHRAEAADAAHQRIDHALHEGAGDRRVDGIAAALQHRRAGLDRFRLRATIIPFFMVRAFRMCGAAGALPFSPCGRRCRQADEGSRCAVLLAVCNG